MNRPCTCGRLLVYSRDGRIPATGTIYGCLTIDELQRMVSLLSPANPGGANGEAAQRVHCTA